MKKGKTSQIDGFENAKIIYGTVDSVNLKSIYLNQENLEFKDNKIKNSLQKITSEIFNNNFNKNKYFKFYLTKTTKILNDEVELQSS